MSAPSALRQTLRLALNDAIKSGQTLARDTLRMVAAEIKQKDIDVRTRSQGKDNEAGDDAIIKLLHSMVKKRQESAALYQKGGRAELADKEQQEIAIIKTFMPEMMDAAATEKAVDAALRQQGATSLAQMGAVLGLLRKEHGTTLDMGKASALIKARLQKT
ncbi:MAG: GatB/YqeY domain-containing protein [Alphaproteobacteria bacterium GM202ARS2]|nr:GatB/YqeY domain-containing protein [Alphaproteobacteria bacterium GM202ARS2]